MKNLIVFTLVASFNYSLFAQCGSGEVEVHIDIHTDSYGYEGYWELISEDSLCGQGTILSGGNTLVGCGGGGLQNQNPGGYANNQTYSSDTACLVDSGAYKIVYVDDWGDGGFEFDVNINGYTIENFTDNGSLHFFSFIAEEPPAYDLTMLHPHLDLYRQQGDVDVEMEVYNAGTEEITSLTIHYSVDGAPVQSQTVAGISIPSGTSEHLVHPNAWSATNNGAHEILIWHSTINGSNTDASPEDDTTRAEMTIGPAKPNVVDSYLINIPVITQIAGSTEGISSPTDLDFHPILSNYELWVVNKDVESTGSSTVTIYEAGKENQDELWRRDGNAWHFMSLTTGLAFSDNGNFGTSPGVYDANHNGGQPFTGPALWSSDPEIYAQPSGGNGSHMDMLHESPECQGIAHESENVFWVFDGFNNDIVRYDFADDHGPGNDDHSDGIVHRFSDVSVSKDPNDHVVSHLAYDKESDWLYVVDYGNSRVFAIDSKSGTLGGSPSFGPFEALAEYRHVNNYDWEIVIDSGLAEPAGIALMGQYLAVSDYSNGEIIIYNREQFPAVELKRIQTEAQGIMGICFGPEGKLWYADYDAKTINRLDWIPDSTLGTRTIPKSKSMAIYPNPSKGTFNLQNLGPLERTWQIHDQTGRLVLKGSSRPGKSVIYSGLEPGTYYMMINASRNHATESLKLIIH